jgi:hypothetical protein
VEVSQNRTRAYTVDHRGVTALPNPVCKLTLVDPYSWSVRSVNPVEHNGNYVYHVP